MATHPGRGEFLLDGIEKLVEPRGVLALSFGLIAVGLQIGQGFDQPLLVVVGRMRIGDGLLLEVPAFPTLNRPGEPGDSTS